MARKVKITRARKADANNAVVSVVTKDKRGHYRREVCAECPWRKDAKRGAFPAEAYRLSAPTSYDAGQSTFACHMSGVENPQTCAGFLLSYNADHNLAVRIAEAAGRVDRSKVRRTVGTYETYREMATVNGVAEDDPAIAPCRVPRAR